MNKATTSPLSKLTEIQKKKAKKIRCTRTTLEIRESYKEKLDRIVYWNNTTIKAVLDMILEGFLFEKDPPPIPRANSKQPMKFFDKNTVEKS